MILRGIKREQCKKQAPKTRLPITIQIMYKLRQLLQENPQDYHNLMMWAACCLAFFGFLRCSEFTTPGREDYDPQVHLQYEDIAVDCRNNPKMLMVRKNSQKLTPLDRGSPYGWERPIVQYAPLQEFALPSNKGISPRPTFHHQEWGIYDKTILPYLTVYAPGQSRPPTETV